MRENLVCKGGWVLEEKPILGNKAKRNLKRALLKTTIDMHLVTAIHSSQNHYTTYSPASLLEYAAVSCNFTPNMT